MLPEFSKAGTLVQFKVGRKLLNLKPTAAVIKFLVKLTYTHDGLNYTQVSCNYEPHLRGNVYAQYSKYVCISIAKINVVCVELEYDVMMMSLTVKRSVQELTTCSMGGGMLRDSYPVNSVPCRSGRLPFVVS